MNKSSSNFAPKLIRTLLTVAAVAAVIFLLLFVGDVKITFEGTHFTASGFLAGSTTVAYDGVNSVEYVRGFDAGSRSMGVGSFKISAGTFKNSLYDSYKLYAYNKCESYIIVEHVGGVLVLNQTTDTETLSLYEALREKTGL